jgi:hypothetical protein
MRLRFLVFLALMLWQLALAPVVAEEVWVIINPSVKHNEMTIKQVRNIFLKKTRLTDSGLRWIPVNLSPDNPLRLAFSEKLFNQLPEDLEQYWNTQYFNGISPPYVVASQEAMRLFVTTTPGAIGYLSACNSDSNVRVVFRLHLPDMPTETCDTPLKK